MTMRVAQSDRRGLVRHKVIKGAQIVFGDEETSVVGLIGNLSEEGARFVVNSPVGIPRDVLLRFPHGEERRAEVMWNKDRCVFGLRFK